MSGIDWNKFGTTYVSVGDGESKTLRVTGWCVKTRSFQSGPKNFLSFSVLAEEGVACDPPRVYDNGNYSFIEKARPLIEAAEASGESVLDIKVSRIGSGSATKYAVTKV
jgi:hypothetical protein